MGHIQKLQRLQTSHTDSHLPAFKMKTAVAVTFFVVCVAAAAAFKCYDCTNSKVGKHSSEGCGDDFNAQALGMKTVECTSYCQKTRGLKIVTRSCNAGCKEAYVGDIITTCCKGELCNAAPAQRGFMYMAVPVAYLLYKVFF